MANPYGLVLDDASLRWAAAEGVAEAVIAAICLLEMKSVDEIVAKLTPAQLEQVIKIIGRCPRCYPPGAYDALKARRLPSSTRESSKRISPGSERSHRSAGRTNPAAQHLHPWTPPRRFSGFGAMAPQSTPKRAAANPYGIARSCFSPFRSTRLGKTDSQVGKFSTRFVLTSAGTARSQKGMPTQIATLNISTPR